tara:strand:- start:48582 stop:49352 length:771 start_codon:yes stop_codon:yes gene_type:complete
MTNISDKDIQLLNSKKGLKILLSQEELNLDKSIRNIKYEMQLRKLQIELLRLQHWIRSNKKRVIIIFEGRDSAGKGGAIRRITEFLNPRYLRIVALPKPSKDEQEQWYFQRYITQFPKFGEILFLDRSWYNRAIVEPVNNFCTDIEYDQFMREVNNFERMLVNEESILIKMYFSITKDEQQKRFLNIQESPLKQWKYSAVDSRAQELWDDYTHYKNEMFNRTNSTFAPWKVIEANKKNPARIQAIKHILKSIPYKK